MVRRCTTDSRGVAHATLTRDAGTAVTRCNLIVSGCYDGRKEPKTPTCLWCVAGKRKWARYDAERRDVPADGR